MAKPFETWTVLEHGPLEQLEDNLWRLEGALPGMELRRVMTIARMGDGRLVVHNAIALEEALMKEIEALGQLAFLVVPNGYHRLDVKIFKDRYPDLKVVCPRAARKKVENVAKVDLTYDELEGDEVVSLRHLAGLAEREGVMIVRHGEGATVVLNDLVFNMPHLSGVAGFIFRHLTGSTGGPRISRLARLAIVKDKAAVAEDLRTLADTPGLERIIVSHHEVIDRDPAATLRRLAEL